MKLESYKDKKVTRKKMILISLGLITIIGVSLLLYKTFANFKKEVTFPFMSGKVNYYGNGDVIFAFYKDDDKKLDRMPLKDNHENLIFDKAICDNGANIEWDENKWAPTVLNLTTSNTKCSIYFKEKTGIQLNKDIPLAGEGQDGLFKVEHTVSEIDDGWNKEEYRYAGVTPNNYVEFNDELWRIIGLVNVLVPSEDGSTKVEQRLKIVRYQKLVTSPWDKSQDYSPKGDWTSSKLKDMLNGIYYNSENGECYNNGLTTCDFTGKSFSLAKGLKDVQNMIDSEVIWNIAWSGFVLTADSIYEKERGTNTYSDFPTEWTKDNDPTYHNGIGLMYASDYGYAVGGKVRSKCLSKDVAYYHEGMCFENNWLYKKNDSVWLLTPEQEQMGWYDALYFDNNVMSRRISTSQIILPTLYLKSNVIIIENPNPNQVYGSYNNPFILYALY